MGWGVREGGVRRESGEGGEGSEGGWGVREGGEGSEGGWGVRESGEGERRCGKGKSARRVWREGGK